MKKNIYRNKKLLANWMVFEVSFAALMIVWSIIISKALEAGMAQEFGKLNNILLYGFVFFMAMMLSFYMQTKCYAAFIGKCTSDLRQDLFRSIMFSDANKLNEQSSARFLSVFNNDIPLITKDYFSGLPNVFFQLFLSVAATVTLFLYSPYLGLFEIVLSVLTSAVPILADRNGSVLQKEYMNALGAYNGKIKDYISAVATLKSYNLEEKFVAIHQQINIEVQNRFYKSELNRGKIYAIVTATRYIESALFLVFGSYMIAAGKISVAIMLGAMQIVGYIVNPVKQAASLYSNYKRTKLVVKDLLSFVDRISKEECEKIALEEGMPLRIENLSYFYGDNKVLDDINLCFEKGKKYAIVGESGSGKSTFINILMQLYCDYTGEIYAGNQNIRDIDKRSFARNYALISQNVILLEDSLKNNITMYGEYSNTDIEKAIRGAGLDKYVAGLPDGMESKIYENGANCSGGEQRRITIARALLRNTPVLLMDEAFSNLDVQTVESIEKTVLSNDALTVISVTHQSVEHLKEIYDYVYKLENGKLMQVA